MSATAIVVDYCDGAKMVALAKARGWVEDTDGILDFVEEYEASVEREFPTLTKAKDWARRNKARDFWLQPAVRIYQWPDCKRLLWQRECVKHLRLIGDGYGWEEIE